MKAKDVAKAVGCSVAWVYATAKKLGRLPTVEEMMERKGKRGRPTKWKE